MESFLRSFSVGFLLRSVFAGMFFVLELWLATGHCLPSVDSVTADQLLSVILFALLAGITIYRLHRALPPYCLYETWNANPSAKQRRKTRSWLKPHIVSDEAVARSLDLWSMAAEPHSHQSARAACAQRTLDWGDSIHFLYTSGYCIVAGALAAWTIVGWTDLKVHWQMMVLAMLFLIAGFFSDCRLAYVTDGMLERWKDPPESPAKG